MAMRQRNKRTKVTRAVRRRVKVVESASDENPVRMMLLLLLLVLLPAPLPRSYLRLSCRRTSRRSSLRPRRS